MGQNSDRVNGRKDTEEQGRATCTEAKWSIFRLLEESIVPDALARLRLADYQDLA